MKFFRADSNNFLCPLQGSCGEIVGRAIPVTSQPTPATAPKVRQKTGAAQKHVIVRDGFLYCFWPPSLICTPSFRWSAVKTISAAASTFIAAVLMIKSWLKGSVTS